MPEMIVKLAFLVAIPIYAVVALFVSQQPLQPQPDPQFIQIFAGVLAVIYAVQTLAIEPLISRSMHQRFGGYCQQIMVVKLAFFESGAIYGLLLSFMTHDLRYLAFFGGVAFLMILFRVPSSTIHGAPHG